MPRRKGDRPNNDPSATAPQLMLKRRPVGQLTVRGHGDFRQLCHGRSESSRGKKASVGGLASLCRKAAACHRPGCSSLGLLLPGRRAIDSAWDVAEVLARTYQFRRLRSDAHRDADRIAGHVDDGQVDLLATQGPRRVSLVELSVTQR